GQYTSLRRRWRMQQRFYLEQTQSFTSAPSEVKRQCLRLGKITAAPPVADAAAVLFGANTEFHERPKRSETTMFATGR
ncbi:MAG: hypothetical protein IK104_09225, partial [Clostridia bacterium]|nr:hypothetical protein [Clostridia bacterium]